MKFLLATATWAILAMTSNVLAQEAVEPQAQGGAQGGYHRGHHHRGLQSIDYFGDTAVVGAGGGSLRDASSMGMGGKGGKGKGGKGSAKGTSAPSAPPSVGEPSSFPSEGPSISFEPSFLPSTSPSSSPSVDFCEESTCTDLQGQIDTLISTVQGIIAINDQQQMMIDALMGNVTALEGQVAMLEGQVATLEGNVTTLDGDIATLEGQVAILEGNVTTLDGDIATLEGQVAILEGNVTTLDGDIATLEGQVAILEGNVTTLDGDIATLEGQVAILQGNVTTLDAQVTALEDCVDSDPVSNTCVVSSGALTLEAEGNLVLRAGNNLAMNSVGNMNFRSDGLINVGDGDTTGINIGADPGLAAFGPVFNGPIVIGNDMMGTTSHVLGEEVSIEAFGTGSGPNAPLQISSTGGIVIGSGETMTLDAGGNFNVRNLGPTGGDINLGNGLTQAINIGSDTVPFGMPFNGPIIIGNNMTGTTTHILGEEVSMEAFGTGAGPTAPLMVNSVGGITVEGDEAIVLESFGDVVLESGRDVSFEADRQVLLGHSASGTFNKNIVIGNVNTRNVAMATTGGDISATSGRAISMTANNVVSLESGAAPGGSNTFSITSGNGGSMDITSGRDFLIEVDRNLEIFHSASGTFNKDIRIGNFDTNTNTKNVEIASGEDFSATSGRAFTITADRDISMQSGADTSLPSDFTITSSGSPAQGNVIIEAERQISLIHTASSTFNKDILIGGTQTRDVEITSTTGDIIVNAPTLGDCSGTCFP